MRPSMPKTLQELRAYEMEKLKPFSQLLEPDERFAQMMLFGEEEDSDVTYTFEDHYTRFALLAPPAKAPEEVVGSFVTSQHLAIASWWFFPFSVVAENQAYCALELALRRRMNASKTRGLAERINHAIREQWLKPDELLELNPCFTPAQRAAFSTRARDKDGVNTLRHWSDEIPRDRNYLAHGNFSSGTDPFMTLDVVAQLLQQLYG